jgi:hypothetical protein
MSMMLILDDVLFALQVCLCLWQFMKLTPVGALIQGVIGWLLRPVRLSPTYTRLQHCHGRVFKRVDCFTLQADVPAERRGIMRAEVNKINLQYLGIHLLLKRSGMDGNMLSIYIKGMNGDMFPIEIMRTDRDMLPIRKALLPNNSRIWKEGKEMQTLEDVPINSTIWQELQTLEEVLNYGIVGPPTADAADSAAAADYRAVADNARTTLFVKCNREFWAEVITGEITTLNEVLDAVIRHNHVIVRLNNEWFLPVNVNLSEEKLLKILNLFALILQTKKVHWLIPTSLSSISASMEFSTRVRVWVYISINVFINVIWHFTCDPCTNIKVWWRFILTYFLVPFVVCVRFVMLVVFSFVGFVGFVSFVVCFVFVFFLWLCYFIVVFVILVVFCAFCYFVNKIGKLILMSLCIS